MDRPSPGGHQKIYKKRGRFWGTTAACTVGRRTKSHHDLLQKAGDTDETPNNYGADAESRCGKRLRTTASRNDDVFGQRWARAINLKQPNTNNGEQDLAGNGTLGPFTFRIVRATATSPQPSSTCSGLYIPRIPSVAGAGLLRFEVGVY